jgi:hypothetical protein
MVNIHLTVVRFIFAASTLLLAQMSLAQLRSFPADSYLGTFQVEIAPDVTIDRKPFRLAPGSLIRNTQNLILTPSMVQGRYWVAYTKDPLGNIKLVWVLTENELAAERARRRN